jgi:hypothetical protein
MVPPYPKSTAAYLVKADEPDLALMAAERTRKPV